MAGTSPRYLPPGVPTRVMNRAVAALARLGVSVLGTHLLYVRGRVTGEWRTTVVNVLPHHNARYLVAPRGDTQWVRNLRASGQARLRLGRRTEPVTAVELPDDEKPPVLRAYLRRWGFEMGPFFDGVSAKAPDADLRRIAGDHPVFRIAPA